MNTYTALQSKREQVAQQLKWAAFAVAQTDEHTMPAIASFRRHAHNKLKYQLTCIDFTIRLYNRQHTAATVVCQILEKIGYKSIEHQGSTYILFEP